MRNGTKKKAMELLATVSEALHYIKTTKGKEAECMLENCSLCMKSIRKSIDHMGDGRHVLLGATEEFEQLLESAQKFSDKPKELRRILFALLKKLALIRSEIEKIQPKLEIVFLPYKASMWDSMESIWRTANADNDCDAYVIPIPYYDRNPDHTASRVHYEANLFPEDVPVIDYRHYNLAERHPDVIYIHNPYDGCNYVTSIDADFYSDKLKQYTDLLVYVSYDVVLETVGEHMCQTPGAKNADLIIVQSDRVKEVYDKYVPSEKVLALGSPKIDKIIWTQNHKPPMPEEWQKIARGRKLILYNTHLTPLMIDGGSVCKKLRHVFSCFEGRNDVCLLWRPHPLSQATMESMNPRPLQDYLQLVEAFKKSKLGIYDDSADVHRAIALSAAYFGDGASSLAPIFELTGKPMMSHDLYSQEETSASFTTYVMDNETIWFPAFLFNGLFKMDILTKQVSFVGKFPGERDQVWMYSKAMKFDDRLFLFPALADSIAEFNTKTKKLRTHSLENISYQFSEGRSFFSAVLWKEWVYLLPFASHVIVKMHISSGELQWVNDWYELLRPFVKDERAALFSSVIQRGKYIWCPYWQSNLVVRFDLETMQPTLYRVGKTNNTYYNMSEGGGYFWIVSQNGDLIVRWNPETLETKEYKVPSCYCQGRFGLFWTMYQDGIVWIYPAAGDWILKMDAKTGQFSEHAQYPSDFNYVPNQKTIMKFGIIQEENKILYAFPINANQMLQIDTQTGCASGLKLPWPECDPAYFDQYIEEEELVEKGEQEVFFQEHAKISSLTGYLDFVSRTSFIKKRTWPERYIQNVDGKCGERIHKKTKILFGY